jgi:hypothetical protein
MPPSTMVEQLVDDMLMEVIIAAIDTIAEQGAASAHYEHLPEDERQLYREAVITPPARFRVESGNDDTQLLRWTVSACWACRQAGSTDTRTHRTALNTIYANTDLHTR